MKLNEPERPARPGGSGKRPNAVASRGQVGADGAVPSRPQPNLGDKHQLYVAVGDEGTNFSSFLGIVDRANVEQSYGNIVGKGRLGL